MCQGWRFYLNNKYKIPRLNNFSIKYFPLFKSLGFVGLFAILIFFIKYFGYGFTYQATISMPKGIYLTFPAKNIKYDDIVIFYPPKIAAEFLAKQHWAPNSGVLMKKVIGMPDDFVCNQNHAIAINGKKLGLLHDFYAPGKKMPHELFCGKLANNQYMLLSTFIDRSYDGRYFGPVTQDQIIAKAKLIKKL